MRFSATAALALAVCLLLMPAPVRADPQLGIPVFATQPNGRQLELRSWGDEFFQTTETIDGYTVTLDPVDGWICYAKLSPDGTELVSTGARVGTVDPAALGLAPKLRISDEALDAIVRARRDRLEADLTARWLALGAPAKAAATGNLVGVTILVDFSDEVGTIPPGDVDDYCNEVGYTGYGNNGSVRDYFHDVSDGLLTYTNQVVPSYYRAANPKAWYEDTTVPYGERARILVHEALDDLEASGFDFSTCDGNGDGRIDAINIFYAGYRGATWAAGLWPHSAGISFSADGVSSFRYQMTDLRNQLQLAVFCHENGHMICGFPDLYDYGYESNGVGRFCLMCYGSVGTNPVEPCAPLKRYADWTTDHELTASESGLTAVAGVNDVYYYPNENLVDATEYYVIENRQQTARDAGLPDAGLAIWHVDELGSNNFQQMTPLAHYEVTLVQADGLWDLERDVNYGDVDDLWKAPSYVECTPHTSPATTWWTDGIGHLSGLAVVNIGASGPVMTFDYEAVDWSTDCNQNGIEDSVDIGNGTSEDVDGNGVPDECEFLIDGIQEYDPVTGVPASPYDRQYVTLAGVVFADKGTLTAGEIHLQDGSGGIRYYVPHADGIAVGDTIRLTARVWITTALGEIFLHDEEADPRFEIVGHGPGPQARVFTVGDLIADYENVGWLAETAGTNLLSYGDGFYLGDDGAIVRVILSELTGIDIGFLQTDSPVTVRGACVNYAGEIQIWPRWQTDLAVPEPVIVRVEDVADDQGRQVHFEWIRSSHDDPDSGTPIQEYDVYRWAESAVPGEWSLVATVPAAAQDLYAIVAPTLADSTVAGGQAYSAFYVRARTVEPTVFFDSPADSGYSVDNLAPGAPQNVAAAYASTGVALDWDDATEADFQVHRVYRNTDPDFTPTVDDLVQETTASAWTDAPPDPWDHHYRITTLDLAGNESAAAAPTSVSGAGDGGVPERTDLLAAVPNPFNPSTRLRFALAAAGHVRLTVYDLAGRRVAVLVDGHRAAGRHHVTWEGRDQAGRPAASGVYFYRLEAGAFRETGRMVLVR